jgi:hypothetical protein
MELVSETSQRSVVTSLISELQRAIDLVHKLDDDRYALATEGESSIGAHIRHNLEFVNELLNGIAARRVDYSARKRDVRVEVDRGHAIDQLSFACDRLKSLTVGVLAALVMVRSEVDEDVWHASSVSREIEFLHSHTIHHYALVAERILEAGSSADPTFGVAPSTLRYRAALEARP